MSSGNSHKSALVCTNLETVRAIFCAADVQCAMSRPYHTLELGLQLNTQADDGKGVGGWVGFIDWQSLLPYAVAFPSVRPVPCICHRLIIW